MISKTKAIISERILVMDGSYTVIDGSHMIISGPESIIDTHETTMSVVETIISTTEINFSEADTIIFAFPTSLHGRNKYLCRKENRCCGNIIELMTSGDLARQTFFWCYLV